MVLAAPEAGPAREEASMVWNPATLVAPLLSHGPALIAQVPKKVSTPVPMSAPRAVPQPGPASPQASGHTLTAVQQRSLQALILQHQRLRARFQAPDTVKNSISNVW